MSFDAVRCGIWRSYLGFINNIHDFVQQAFRQQGLIFFTRLKHTLFQTGEMK